jgi:acetyltransferase-like isoleucine patch superfamily enzyme
MSRLCRVIRGELVSIYLRARGSRVGRGLRCEGFPVLRIADFKRLQIGRGTVLEKRVVLWQNGLGSILIGDFCYIGIGTILNSTSDSGRIELGNETLIGAYCLVQDNDHGTNAMESIRNQPFVGAPISIGNDCWIGAHVSILKGVRLGDGCVIGAGAVVTRDIHENSIAVGVPARIVGERSRMSVRA